MTRRSSARSFDPRRVGGWECRAWAAYYRRAWWEVLVASVALVRAGFGMGWLRTLRGSWLVLRANQKWAPFPDNDPAASRRLMERFYRLVAEAEGEPLDTAEAARREVAWWAAHRQAQRGTGDVEAAYREVVDALVGLYTFLYGCGPDDARPAARLRAQAMDVSDRWVDAGCDPASPLLDEERVLLVRSYAALLAAVHR